MPKAIIAYFVCFLVTCAIVSAFFYIWHGLGTTIEPEALAELTELLKGHNKVFTIIRSF